jgi:hypothetical protein
VGDDLSEGVSGVEPGWRVLYLSMSRDGVYRDLLLTERPTAEVGVDKGVVSPPSTQSVASPGLRWGVGRARGCSSRPCGGVSSDWPERYGKHPKGDLRVFRPAGAQAGTAGLARR